MLSPAWLLGLLLVPAIRWLHRGGQHRRTLPVADIDLWRASAARAPAEGRRRPPDPAWRRRAVLCALLFVALAQPQLPSQRVRLTLWVDDSLSMLTREDGTTRLALGLAQARARLATLAAAEFELRTLSDPWHTMGVLDEAAVASLVAGAGRREPAAPPAALLRRDRLHWLLTDGADGAVLEWPGGRHPDDLIQVAGVTRNVGLERLSARRDLDDPQRFDLLLKITNGGSAPETRELAFATEAGESGRSTQRLEPGASVLVAASIPAAAAVRARLQPADALPEDDEIVLDLAPLRARRIAVDAKCAPALLAAVRAHPAVATVAAPASDAEAVIDCGGLGAAAGGAVLRVLADRVPGRLQGPLQWSDALAGSRRIRLEPASLPVSARLQPQPGDSVLMALGNEPVLLGRAGRTPRLETALDFASMATGSGPELPLLVNLMLEQLLASRLLDTIALVDRGPAAVHVAPRAAVAPAAAETTTGSPAPGEDWSRPLLVAALLVLAWEIVALGRRWRRLGT